MLTNPVIMKKVSAPPGPSSPDRSGSPREFIRYQNWFLARNCYINNPFDHIQSSQFVLGGVVEGQELGLIEHGLGGLRLLVRGNEQFDSHPYSAPEKPTPQN